MRMIARRPVAWVLLLFAGVAVNGCHGCGKSKARERSTERAQASEPPDPIPCTTAADCADDDPCTRDDCVGGHCLSSLAPEGTSCDNGTVCDGVSQCDSTGQCVAGVAPVLDDGNACTQDTCDPLRGVVHQPLPVDDANACTLDACNPQTGEITHSPINPDDGDDCTVDSCDPRIGVRHQGRSATYTCNPGCEPGFHSTSRRPAAECGSPQAVQSVCQPDCGGSFYTCDANCPSGYRAVSRTPNGQCGRAQAFYTFCLRSPAGAVSPAAPTSS